MPVSVNAASEIYQEAIRDSVRRSAFLYLVQAGLMIVAGILAIIFPIFSAQTITLAIGWLLILSGLMQGLSLIATWRASYASLQLMSAVLGVLIGVLILMNPAQSIIGFSLLIVVFFMMEGLGKLIWALTIRPLPGWPWVALSGALGMVLSVFLIANLETAASWVLAMLVGLQLIVIGAAIGYLAWSIRMAAKA
ncbi:HdeD family acid-resistance protein [Pelagibacterium lacus]|uniref:HdeD family acid-resistance protein n=1 Tax=Pelagibacterium lacus TaxID=2282655 RepID=A0A369W7X3_9HYPH|nr:DUF308 domain-containing protein [Pelagibacterium lacus]RDE09352.1 HdeD family acid-resistance protein [Pelagibacterium lacus]